MIGKPGTKWSEHEVEHLRRRVAEGALHAAIGSELGRTAEAVSSKAKLLGLTTLDRIRLWTPQEDETLRRMRAHGATARKIGEVLNRNRGAVDKRLQYLGLCRSKAGRPKAAAPPEEAPAKPIWVPPDERMDLVRLWQAANKRLCARNSFPAGRAF